MIAFSLTHDPIDTTSLRARIESRSSGAVVIFEGVVRDHHAGRAVSSLEYEGYAPMATPVGQALLAEAAQRFGLAAALGVHRLGHLEIGDIAVVIIVASSHRGAAFSACAWIMDELKARVPVWKHEHFADGSSEWNRGTTIRGADAPEKEST
jgi:molybdopterin synthase catalytic subunit